MAGTAYVDPAVYGQVLQIQLERGEAGIDQTAAAMIAMIHSGAASARVQDFARRRGLDHRSQGVAPHLFELLKSHVRFRPDPKGVELLRHPDQLVTEIDAEGVAYGDCDDLAMLGASLCLAVGQDAALIVMAPPGSSVYQHTYFAHVTSMPGYPKGHLTMIDPQECEFLGMERPSSKRKAYPV